MWGWRLQAEVEWVEVEVEVGVGVGRRRTVDALVLRQYLVHTARQVRGQGLACRSSGRRVCKSGISARTRRIDRYPYCSGADAIERGVLWATGIQPEKHRTAAIDQVLTGPQTGP